MSWHFWFQKTHSNLFQISFYIVKIYFDIDPSLKIKTSEYFPKAQQNICMNNFVSTCWIQCDDFLAPTGEL